MSAQADPVASTRGRRRAPSRSTSIGFDAESCTSVIWELGYALGRQPRLVISAQEGTKLPFDEDKLPTYFWKDAGTVDERRRAYLDWLDRYNELPPIVE